MDTPRTSSGCLAISAITVSTNTVRQMGVDTCKSSMIGLVFLAFGCLCLVKCGPVITEEEQDKQIPRIYYNPWTNESVPILTSGEAVKLERVRFGRLPCSCSDLICGCCSACLNLTYDPYEFAIGLNMLVNDESIFQNRVSAKSPPPVCIPVPAPLPVLPNLDFCIRLYDVYTPTPGYNLHACLNFETRLQRAPLLVLEFDCMRMGTAGVQILKPEDNGGLTTTTPESTQEAEDEYDTVNEDKSNSTSSKLKTKVI